MLWSHIFLSHPKPASGRTKSGRSRQIREKQASGPIQAVPPRKVSMTRASFGRNHWEIDFFCEENVFGTRSFVEFHVVTNNLLFQPIIISYFNQNPLP